MSPMHEAQSPDRQAASVRVLGVRRRIIKSFDLIDCDTNTAGAEPRAKCAGRARSGDSARDQYLVEQPTAVSSRDRLEITKSQSEKESSQPRAPP